MDGLIALSIFLFVLVIFLIRSNIQKDNTIKELIIAHKDYVKRVGEIHKRRRNE